MDQHACKLGLEGVVSKARDSTYVSRRGNSWVTKTCQQRATLTIAGFALDGQKWDGSIWPAQGQGPCLCRQGRPRLRHQVGCRSAQAPDAAHPQDTALHQANRPRGIWVEPQLLAEIEYRASLLKEKCGIPSFWVCAKTSEMCRKERAGSRSPWISAAR